MKVQLETRKKEIQLQGECAKAFTGKYKFKQEAVLNKRITLL